MFNISYIIATRNRRQHLEMLLLHILPFIREDEELIIIDGRSTDGTGEMVETLYKQGIVHQYLSEPDHNQAHAWNKALLMARGKLIKKLIDDDVHSLQAIRTCKTYMLENLGVDFCISNCLEAELDNPDRLVPKSRLQYYLDWKAGKVPSFTFSDVSMLIRRSALSYSGLFDTQLTMIDWEFSLRISYLKMSIVYFTGYNSLTVNTPGNVTSTATKEQFRREEELGRLKYAYPGDQADISFYSHLKIYAGTVLHSIKRKNQPEKATSKEADLAAVYQHFYKKLEDINLISPGEFVI